VEEVSNTLKLRFFMAMSMKMAVFWNIAPLSVVDTDQRFIGPG
jgi:hypothetical protein